MTYLTSTFANPATIIPFLHDSAKQRVMQKVPRSKIMPYACVGVVALGAVAGIWWYTRQNPSAQSTDTISSANLPPLGNPHSLAWPTAPLQHLDRMPDASQLGIANGLTPIPSQMGPLEGALTDLWRPMDKVSPTSLDTHSQTATLEQMPANGLEQTPLLSNRLLSKFGEMFPWDKKAVLATISNIPEPDRENVLEYAFQLIPLAPGFEDKHGKAAIIKAISFVPPNQRPNVIQHAVQFIKTNTKSIDIADLIKVVFSIPAERREQLHYASELMSSSIWENGKTIIQAVGEIPVQERMILRRISSFITYDMSEFARVDIIKAIFRVPHGERRNVIKVADRFMSSKATAGERIKIIEMIAGIPMEYREDIIGRVRLIVTPQTLGKAIIDAINQAITPVRPKL